MFLTVIILKYIIKGGEFYAKAVLCMWWDEFTFTFMHLAEKMVFLLEAQTHYLVCCVSLVNWSVSQESINASLIRYNPSQPTLLLRVTDAAIKRLPCTQKSHKIIKFYYSIRNKHFNWTNVACKAATLGSSLKITSYNKFPHAKKPWHPFVWTQDSLVQCWRGETGQSQHYCVWNYRQNSPESER